MEMLCLLWNHPLVGKVAVIGLMQDHRVLIKFIHTGFVNIRHNLIFVIRVYVYYFLCKKLVSGRFVMKLQTSNVPNKALFLRPRLS